MDLYRAVGPLVERFQVALDEVLQLLVLERDALYSEAVWARLDTVNHRLVAIALDMREIASHIDQMLARDSRLRERLLDVSKLCLGVSDMEFEFVELTLGVPEDLPDDGHHPWVDDRWHGVLRAPVVRDAMSGGWPGPETTRALRRARAQLDSYLRDLRLATAKTLTHESINHDRTQ